MNNTSINKKLLVIGRILSLLMLILYSYIALDLIVFGEDFMDAIQLPGLALISFWMLWFPVWHTRVRTTGFRRTIISEGMPDWYFQVIGYLILFVLLYISYFIFFG